MKTPNSQDSTQESIQNAFAISERLAAEFPKRCGCGREYCGPTSSELPLSWDMLPLAYHYTDDFATQEARHCVCLSTITVLIAIHDLGAE